MQTTDTLNQSPSSSNQVPSRFTPTKWLALLVAVGGFMLFFGLGNRGLNEPDEARYAEIPREMVESGDYISPRLDGLLFLDKPPLMYWATAFSYQIFGVNEFGARFPVALCALVGVVAVFLIGRQMGGPLAGFLSGWVLVTSLEYFILARTLTLDMMLATWTTLALWSFWKWHSSGGESKAALYSLYVFVGLGVMTKGPVAVVIVGATVLLYLVLVREWRALRQMKLVWGAIIVALIAIPWFVAAASRHREFLGFFFGNQNAARFLTSVHGRSRPWWFFIAVLLGGLMPWTPLLVPALIKPFRHEANQAKSSVAKPTVFLLCWALVPLVFFSVSQSKLFPYILPVLAPLALLVGNYLAGVIQDAARSVRQTLWAGLLPVIMLAALLLAMRLFLASALHIQNADIHRTLLLNGVVVVAALVLAVLGRLWKRPLALLGLGVTTSILVYSTMAALVPHIETSFGSNAPTKSLAKIIAAEREPGDLIAVDGVNVYGLSFYLRTHAFEVNRDSHLNLFEEDKSGARQFKLMDEDSLHALLEARKQVFVVTSARRFDALKSHIKGTLYELGRSGSYVLFSNQPRRRQAADLEPLGA